MVIERIEMKIILSYYVLFLMVLDERGDKTNADGDVGAPRGEKLPNIMVLWGLGCPWWDLIVSEEGGDAL